MVLEGGTLTSSAGAWSSLLVRLVFGRAGNVVEIGWLVVGTLLGPEGVDLSGEPGGCFLVQGCPVSRTAVPPVGVRGSGGGVWVVSGRTLRTAQWTRASLDSVCWSSCRFPLIDVLPGVWWVGFFVWSSC